MPTARVLDALQVLVRPPDECGDGEYLQRFLTQRDEAAFAELVRRHGPLVYGACRRILNNSPEADDAFQATFFVLARKAGSIRSSHAVGAWLYGVAVKVANKVRVQAVKRRMRQMAAAKPEAVHPAPPQADLWAVLDEELAKLPDELRQAVLTCDVNGQSRSAAAKQLGWPEGTVAKRLAKARETLAKRLTRRGITLSVSAVSVALAESATAAVPPQLVHETASQAATFAIGGGVSSPAVQLLAEGILRSLKVGVLKVWAVVGLLALTLAGGSFMLAGAPGDGDKKADTPKPDAANVATMWKEIHVIDYPGALPLSVAYSADGQTLLTGDTNSEVMAVLFDNYGAKWRWKSEVVEAKPKPVYAMAYSADGKTIYTTAEHGLRVIDAATGKGEAGIEAKDSNPTGIGVFPDTAGGPKVAFGNARGYFVKSWAAGKFPDTVGTIETKTGATDTGATAMPLAIDPKGRSAIMVGPRDESGQNVLWAYVCGDYAEGSPGNRLMPGHTATVVSATWAKDGNTAVTGDAEGRVIVWDAKTMKETRRLELGGRIAALAINHDGTHTAAYVLGKQGEVYAWDTAKPTNALKPIYSDDRDYGGTANFACLAFSPDGKRLAGCASNLAWLNRLGELVGKVRVWELANEPKAQPAPRLIYTKDLPKGASKQFVIFDNRSILAPGLDDGSLQFRDLCDNGQTLSQLGFGKFKIGGLKLSTDRQWLAMEQHAVGNPNVTDTFDVSVWDMKKLFPPVGTIPDCKRLLDMASGGKVVAVVREKQIELWDVVAKKLLKAAPFAHTRIDAAAFSPDGKLLAISDRNDLVLWRWTEGAHERIELGRTVGSLVFSPDGKFLAEGPSPRDNVQLREVTTRKIVQKLANAAKHSMDVPRLVYSNDRRTLIGCDTILFDKSIPVPHRITLWDTHTGGVAHSLALPGGLPVNLDISPNGRYLTVILEDADGLKLSTWDLTGQPAAKPAGAAPPAAATPTKLMWKESKPIELPGWPVQSFSVTPDGTRLAAATSNGVVSIHDPATHARLDKGRIAQLKAPANRAGLAFSPLGNLAFTGQNGIVVYDHERLLDEVPVPLGGWKTWEGIANFDPHQIVWTNDTITPGWLVAPEGRLVATNGATFREVGWSIEGQNYKRYEGETWESWEHYKHQPTLLASVPGATRLLYAAGPAKPGELDPFRVFVRLIDHHPHQVRELIGHTARPTTGAMTADSTRFLSGDESGTLILWNGETFVKQQSWKLNGSIAAIAMTAGAQHAAVLVMRETKTETTWDLYTFDATAPPTALQPTWTTTLPGLYSNPEFPLKGNDGRTPIGIFRAALQFQANGKKLYASLGEPYVRGPKRTEPDWKHPPGIRVWERASTTVAKPERRELTELRPKKEVDPHPFAVAFSPDDKTLAVSDGDGTATLWDAVTLKQLWKDEANGGQLASHLDFSPNGDEVAVATGDSIRFLEAKTGKVRRQSREQKVYHVAYSPDGKKEAVTDSLFVGATGARWARLTDVPVPTVGINVKLSPCGLAWSPDSTRVAVLGQPQSGVPGSNVAVWEPGDKSHVWLQQEGKLEWLFAVRWSKDGKSILAGGDGGRILMWSGANFAKRREIATDGWNVRSLVLSPDGQTVYAGLTRIENPKEPQDRWVRTACVKAFDFTTGKETFTQAIDGEAAIALALDSTGRRLAVASGVSPFESESSTWSGKDVRVEVWTLPMAK